MANNRDSYNGVLVASSVIATVLLLFITFVSSSTRILQDRFLQESNSVLGVIEDTSEPPVEPVYETVRIPSGDYPIYSVSSSDLYIVEFVGYESAQQYRYFTTVYYELLEKYVLTGKATYQYREFPLQFHPDGEVASIAASCVYSVAGSPGYINYHDQLLKNIPVSSDIEYLTKIANIASVNERQFTTCMSDTVSIKAELSRSLIRYNGLGINNSPTVVIGKLQDDGYIIGTKVSGALEIEEYDRIISEML